MMEGKKPEFSIIVIFSRENYQTCLSSLLAQKGVEFEIIAVVDNPSNIQEKDERIKWLVVKENNPALRRNLAVKQAQAELVAFIDDDAWAEKDWLLQAKKIFDTRPELAGFGGVNIAPEEMSAREELVDLILKDHIFGSGSKAYRKNSHPHPARAGEIHLCNFFLKKDILEQVGGFNEKIGYGAEDSELVYLIKKKLGKEIWFYPELWVWHQRRKFGWGYLKRNFRFRRNNGKLIWLYPEIYLWNHSLWAGLGSGVLGLILLCLAPKIFFWLLLFYFAFFSFWSFFRLKRKWLFILAGFAYFLHHLSYLLGLFTGLLEGLIMGRTKLRQKFGRENFEPS